MSWDPDKYYAEGRQFFEALRNAVPAVPKSDGKGMRPYEEWQKDLEKMQDRREKLQEWDRIALSAYRARWELFR